MTVRIADDAVYDDQGNLLGEFDQGAFVPSLFHLRQPLAYHDEVRDAIARQTGRPVRTLGDVDDQT
jgi:hypothetical protein